MTSVVAIFGNPTREQCAGLVFHPAFKVLELADSGAFYVPAIVDLHAGDFADAIERIIGNAKRGGAPVLVLRCGDPVSLPQNVMRLADVVLHLKNGTLILQKYRDYDLLTYKDVTLSAV